MGSSNETRKKPSILTSYNFEMKKVLKWTLLIAAYAALATAVGPLMGAAPWALLQMINHGSAVDLFDPVILKNSLVITYMVGAAHACVIAAILAYEGLKTGRMTHRMTLVATAAGSFCVTVAAGLAVWLAPLGFEIPFRSLLSGSALLFGISLYAAFLTRHVFHLIGVERLVLRLA